MKILSKTHLEAGSTKNGEVLARKVDIPTKLPADGGDADTIGGKSPSDFAPISHVGSGGSQHSIVTTASAGFMSSSQLVKLNGIETGATKTETSASNGNVKINGSEVTIYTHPSSHAASMITESTTRRFVSDTEKSTWNAKQNALGFTPENSANKGVASGYASLDSNAKIPSGQIPSIYTPIAHVGTGGSAHAVVTTSVAGFMSSAHLSKLNGISTGANKTSQSATNGNVLVDGSQIVVYAHPSSHAASMITESTSRRFVSDTEKSTWNAKQNALGFTPENSANKGTNGGYAGLDSNGKIPLSHIPDTAKQQTYVVSNSTERNALSNLIEGDKAFETATGDTYIWDGSAWQVVAEADWENITLEWGNISGRPSSSVANIDNAVSLRHSHSNKTILDNITASYTATEETKLAGIETNANNYSHPSSHAASMITESTSRRFVSDTEKSTWNGKQDALGYTPLNPANNLSDITTVSSARTNLGLTGNSNTTHYHDGRYYTKTNMQTSGQSNLHWNNLTNVPTSFPADGGDADTIGGIGPNQFLRKDIDDSMNASLTVTEDLTVNGSVNLGGGASVKYNENTKSIDFNFAS